MPSAHLRCLATGVGLGTISRSSGIVRFVEGGVAKPSATWLVVIISTQICFTLAVVSLSTAIFVRISLQSFDPENENGHHGGNLAVAYGSTLAGLLYTPLLAYFVWGVSWWLAILITPSAFVTGMFGFVLSLPLLNVIEWIFPSPTE